MSKKLAAFILALGLCLAGCGKESPPSPPVPDIPREVTDLVVSQHGDKVVLEWSYPSLTTSGKSLASIQKIVVYRFDEELPESLAEKEVEATPEVPRSIALFAQIETPTPTQFKRASIPAAELSGESLPGHTVGTLVIFEDAPQLQSSAGRSIRYTYAVVTEGVRTQSALSNLVSIVPQPPVASPERLIANLNPELVRLRWEPTTTTAGGTGAPFVIGYRVYRSFLGDSGTLLNKEPVKETKFDDRPPYGTYAYHVTAVTAVDPDIESTPSDAVAVEFRDLLPPPTPDNVAALVEDEAVRLIWDPVVAPDFAGYIVYRWDGQVKIRLNEKLITETSYRDASPSNGATYVYGVTSVDTNGNESAQTTSSEVTFIR